MSKYPNRWAKVVLLGDSLTEFSFNEDGNFGGLLQSFLKRRSDVLNRGFSGYTSETLKLVVPKILTEEFLKDVACLTLCIGANDSWSKTSYRFNPALPVEKYKKNLVEIIEHLTKNNLAKEKIIMITPPTIVEKDWLEYCKQNKEFIIEKTPEQTKLYVDAMKEVGKDLGILVLDAFELTSREENVNRAFVDGLHFSAFGGKLIFDLIKDEVGKRVEQYRDSTIDNFPTYLDIDYNNLDTFFG